jgi:hypothetical protein
LARRAARDAKDAQLTIAPTASAVQRKVFLKIGRPGYRVTKVRDMDTGKEGMMVQVHLPQIKPGVLPRRRFMSAWEQKREPPNKAYQYLIVSHGISPCSALTLCARLLPNLMRPLLSGYLQERSKTSRMMQVTGIGHTGTQIRSSIASNLCLGWHIDSVLYFA